MKRSVYLLFCLRNAKARRSIYSGSFLFGGIGVFLTNTVLFLSYWSMVRFFGTRIAIDITVVSVMFGTNFIFVALARMVAPGLAWMSNEISVGGLDFLLMRPVPIWLQILGHDILLRLAIPLAIWTSIIGWIVATHWATVNVLTLLLSPVFIALAAIAVYALQGIGFALAFFYPRVSAAGEIVDPSIEMAGRVPKAGESSGFVGLLLVFCNVFGFAFGQCLFSPATFAFVPWVLGLALGCFVVVRGYLATLSFGLKLYGSGQAST